MNFLVVSYEIWQFVVVDFGVLVANLYSFRQQCDKQAPGWLIYVYRLGVKPKGKLQVAGNIVLSAFQIYLLTTTL